MFWRFIGAVAAMLLFVLTAQLDAFVAQAVTGCHHNGSWYADKSLVPTTEKCLNCQCNKKTLVCRLKVCPEMPMPPPRGCVVVQKKTTCCPYLSCARLDAFYKIPTQRRIIAYLDHYERESIDRVVNENVLQRRSDDSEVDLYVCVKNGTVYKSGSAMSSSNLCTYCYCIGGTEKCVKPKCMLPVEGCKPIFVDSTCCPVRYDCSTKHSGKSSQEVRYRKNSNKHFMRMAQRQQRQGGCTVGQQYYVEGHKMKSDEDKPCDVCFCIRGSRRCLPKKCAPALKNCMPVVPKGQCCPSSYDCGSQRDYRRAQSSRQFNLYSLLFGKDEGGESNSTEIPVQYPHDRDPGVTAAYKQKQKIAGHTQTHTSTSEKSIFDTIREGLEFIDSNNNQMLAENIDNMASKSAEPSTKVETSTPTLQVASSSTEVSFLDLLLGPSESLNNDANDVEEDESPEEKTTTGYSGLSWVDILLGPDEEEKNEGSSTISDKLSKDETTTNWHTDYSTYSSIDRLGDDFEDFSGSGEISVGELDGMEMSTTDTSTTLSSIPETTEVRLTEETTQNIQTTLTMADEAEGSTTEAIATERVTVKEKLTKNKPKIPSTTTTTTTMRPSKKKPTITTTMKPIRTTSHKPEEKLHKTDSLPLNEKPVSIKNETIIKPEKKNGLLSALLDGISGMLSVEKVRNSTAVKSNNATKSITKPTLQPMALPTPKPLPSFKPLPTSKSHTRINSKIANLTANTPMVSTKHRVHNSTFKPLPPVRAISTTTVQPTTTTTPTVKTTTSKVILITTTGKPLLIKTNPTILEAEPLDNNAEPTLPPSLPNLKIIPFLPTDAVKADRNPALYDFYHSNSPVSKMGYELYDDANVYPSITERYPTYTDLEDNSKAEYIYKFNVEGPEPVITSTTGKLDSKTASGTASAFVKYDFVGSGSVNTKGFSPPTKTEGGFVPKEPLLMEGEEVEPNYQVTQHIIDITTSEPLKENTTKVIEITTPDPFKDVIKTETPPDLTTLIEDKAKNSVANQQHHFIDSDHRNNSEIIHITTGRPAQNIITNYTDYAENRQEVSSNKFPALNQTTLDDILLEDKNSIESFLDLLMKDEEDAASLLEHLRAKTTTTTITTSTTSTIPPFRTLPQTGFKRLSTQPTAAKPTTTTARPTTTNKPAVRNKTTTPRTKSKPKPSIRRNPATSTTPATTTTTTTTTTLAPRTTKKPKVSSTRRTTTRTTITPTRPPSTTTSSPKAPTTSSNIIHISTTTMNPFLMSPFDKLPFMDASFEVKPNQPAPPKSNTNNLLGLVHYKNSLNKFEGLEPAYETFHTTERAKGSYSSTTASTSTTTTTTATATSTPKLIEKSASLASSSLSSSATATNSQLHASSNSLIDPTGILKLAGCNIYGRMYRVGRIILELSSPCLECKCTEVGVKCGPLDC